VQCAHREQGFQTPNRIMNSSARRGGETFKLECLGTSSVTALRRLTISPRRGDYLASTLNRYILSNNFFAMFASEWT
jgi:hypothetical protein